MIAAIVSPDVTDAIAIDIWSDIACPWCYIGKRNFEKALKTIAADDSVPKVEVTFHSFELAPDVPVDYVGSQADYLSTRKGMPREQIALMLEHVTNVAANAGLEYHLDDVQTTNTVKAHELLHFAKSKGKQLEMNERLMSAYFVEGLHVGRVDELVTLATQVGLDEAEVRTALETEKFLPAVRHDQAQAQAYGIQGVPFFVIDGKYGISGAQPAEAFANVLRDRWAERTESADA